MHRSVRLLALAAIALLASACAITPMHVKMDPQFWNDKQQAVVVAVSELPEADHQMLGQQGLLDVAINQGNAAELVAYLKTVDTSGYAKVKSDVSQALRARGFRTQEHPGHLNVAGLPDFEAPEQKDGAAKAVYADKDFRSLAKKFGPNRLLLVEVRNVGTQRNYFGFIPTSAPAAMINVRGQIVDLRDNRVLWREMLNEVVAIDDPWDEPPSFPNVGRALQKVLLVSRKNVQRVFDQPSVAAAEAAR